MVGLEGPLLPILNAVQEEFSHVPRDCLPVIAEALNLARRGSGHRLILSRPSSPPVLRVLRFRRQGVKPLVLEAAPDIRRPAEATEQAGEA
jgi:hypothetical protein